jgi:hypothetical protein
MPFLCNQFRFEYFGESEGYCVRFLFCNEVLFICKMNSLAKPDISLGSKWCCLSWAQVLWLWLCGPGLLSSSLPLLELCLS